MPNVTLADVPYIPPEERSIQHILLDFVSGNDIQNKVLVKNSYVPYSIIGFYVLFVTWIGPKIMKSRQPYNIQKTLIIYNLLQTIANSYIAYDGIIGIIEHWDSRCLVRKSPKYPYLLQRAMRSVWQLYLIKFADLLDTVFFVLRKKQSQASFLHVFHHAGMCLLYHWGLRNLYKTPGFYMAIGFVINTAVHVIMYTYYCLAAFGPKMQKYLWWKKHLTRLQIGQFLVILLYIIIAVLTGCEELGRLDGLGLVYVFVVHHNMWRVQRASEPSPSHLIPRNWLSKCELKSLISVNHISVIIVVEDSSDVAHFLSTSNSMEFSGIYDFIFPRISTSNSMGFSGIYDFIFPTKFQDQLLFRDPNLGYFIISAYLLFVYLIGPAFMKNRKPYTLQKTLVFYNFLQVLFNIYVSYQTFSDVIDKWDIRCMVKNNPNLHEIIQNAMKYFWLYYLLKFVDLLDTVFFILRKKQSQVTFLHVVHHVGLCLGINWGFQYKYQATASYIAIGVAVNAAVHVIMYSYYGLAACGPSVRKHLWWKKYLTLVQISQIFFVLAYMIYGFLTGCEEFGHFEKLAFSFLALNFFLFLNFYKIYEKKKHLN